MITICILYYLFCFSVKAAYLPICLDALAQSSRMVTLMSIAVNGDGTDPMFTSWLLALFSIGHYSAQMAAPIFVAQLPVSKGQEQLVFLYYIPVIVVSIVLCLAYYFVYERMDQSKVNTNVTIAESQSLKAEQTEGLCDRLKMIFKSFFYLSDPYIFVSLLQIFLSNFLLAILYSELNIFIREKFKTSRKIESLIWIGAGPGFIVATILVQVFYNYKTPKIIVSHFLLSLAAISIPFWSDWRGIVVSLTSMMFCMGITQSLLFPLIPDLLWKRFDLRRKDCSETVTNTTTAKIYAPSLSLNATGCAYSIGHFVSVYIRIKSLMVIFGSVSAFFTLPLLLLRKYIDR